MQVPPRSRGMRVVLAGVGLLVVVALPLLLAKRFSHRPPDRSGEQVEPATVYRNTKPDVAYVGDQACADCHPTDRGLPPPSHGPVAGSRVRRHHPAIRFNYP